MVNLFELLKGVFRVTSSSRFLPNPSSSSKRLRFEHLENRRMLSATSSDSPLDNDSSIGQSISGLVSVQSPQDYEITTPSQVVSDSSLTSAESIVGQSISDNEVDLFFEKFGVYINGEKYICIWDLQYLPTIGDPRTNPNVQDQDSIRGEPDPNTDPEEYDLELGITYYGCQSSGQESGIELHEGHNSVLPFPGALNDPESTDYLSVVLPTIPPGYFSVISFGGSASTNDYFAYVPYSIGDHSIYDGYIHSGSSITVYIKIVDDRITETDETLSMTLGYPSPYWGVSVIPYNFNEICTTVSATIIDNDGWKVGFVPADGIAGEKVITETNNGEIDFRLSRIDNGSNHGSDTHYLIDVKFTITGTASPNASPLPDYRVFLNNADGSRSLITPEGSGYYIVRIQENHLFETITIKAEDDSIVERLEETLSLTITEAKGYPPFLSYAIDSTPVTIIIRDNDKLELVTVQFKNNLNLTSDTEESFGVSWQNRIHWYSDDFTRTLPVAYSSNESMKCQAIITGQLDPTQTYQIRMKWNYRIDDETHTFSSGWETLSDSSVTTELLSSFRSILGQQRATYYDLHSSVEWEFRTTSEATRGADGYMGANVNPLYVTYKTPGTISSPIYHSLVHIGCVAANSTSCSNDQVFASIWSKISSKTITKVKLNSGIVIDDTLLYYYGRDIDESGSLTADEDDVLNYLSATKISGTNTYITDQSASLARQIRLDTNILNGYTLPTGDSLLYYKDGTCDVWRDFAINLCGIQGLSCSSVNIEVNASENVNSFKIDPTLTGQGGVTPRENTWSGHALIRYNDYVYDPSYGLAYGEYDTFLTSFISKLDSVGNETDVVHSPYGHTYEAAYSGATISSSLFTLDPPISTGNEED